MSRHSKPPVRGNGMNVEDAYTDLKYLLNRGYRKSYALRVVSDHYRLTLEERHLLARCVFPDTWIVEVQGKLLRPNELRGRSLAIDGFNVLITIESLIDGKAILCEDGLVRDLKHQGRYRVSERTGPIITEAMKALAGLGVSELLVFYGRAVPKSGIVRKLTEGALEESHLRGKVELVKSPDFKLKGYGTVATADVGIISRVPHVFDVPRLIGKRRGLEIPPFKSVMQRFTKKS